jgi:hypothetical protein
VTPTENIDFFFVLNATFSNISANSENIQMRLDVIFTTINQEPGPLGINEVDCYLQYISNSIYAFRLVSWKRLA